MKVVCESCQAKYQVPDERVAGKKLKIRCKRCGATVLIRGDLLQGESAVDRSVSSAGSLVAADPVSREIAGYEWHVSLDGDTRGPFSLEELRAWLNSTPGGWDAHVWHEGFQDWMDARACAELDPPAQPIAAAMGSGFAEDELPPETLPAPSSPSAQFLAEVSGAAHGTQASGGSVQGLQSQFRRNTAQSALRSRPVSGLGEVRAQVPSSPAFGGERPEDSVLFSSSSLQTMTGNSPAGTSMTGPSMPSASSYVHGPNPGFASGEGSGLIDIRALASLARQSTAQLNPAAAAANKAAEARNAAASALKGEPVKPAPDAGFSFGEDYARPGTAGLSSAYARVDSLAPVSHAQTSNAALPLAILGGCALVAAAVLAAVLFTRSSRDAEMAAASSHVQESPAAASQPHSGPESAADVRDTMDRDDKREPGAAEAKAAEPSGTPVGAETDDEDELAAGKAKRQPRSPHTAVEEKKNATPEEKAKPKKEEKPEPPESSDVMVAERPKAKPAEPPAVAAAPTAAAAPAAPAAAPAVPARPASAEVDDLLAPKQAAAPKPAAKGGASIEDLLAAADKGDKPAPAPAAKPAAPAPTASAALDEAAAASDLPELPSRDETLAAMRGVEAAVRACTAPESVTGTAEVAVVVTGATGRVTSATVTGITGAVGSCIARAVRGARFPRFSKPTFSIKYPYRF